MVKNWKQNQSVEALAQWVVQMFMTVRATVLAGMQVWIQISVLFSLPKFSVLPFIVL